MRYIRIKTQTGMQMTYKIDRAEGLAELVSLEWDAGLSPAEDRAELEKSTISTLNDLTNDKVISPGFRSWLSSFDKEDPVEQDSGSVVRRCPTCSVRHRQGLFHRCSTQAEERAVGKQLELALEGGPKSPSVMGDLWLQNGYRKFR